MSTQFPVFEDSGIKIELDERSCKFYIDVQLSQQRGGPTILENGDLICSSEKKLTESEVIDVAVSLLGPLFYYSPGPDILEEFAKRLKKRGYL